MALATAPLTSHIDVSTVREFPHLELGRSIQLARLQRSLPIRQATDRPWLAMGVKDLDRVPVTTTPTLCQKTSVVSGRYVSRSPLFPRTCAMLS